jgi:hypothetical protein
MDRRQRHTVVGDNPRAERILQISRVGKCTVLHSVEGCLLFSCRRKCLSQVSIAGFGWEWSQEPVHVIFLAAVEDLCANEFWVTLDEETHSRMHVSIVCDRHHSLIHERKSRILPMK